MRKVYIFFLSLLFVQIHTSQARQSDWKMVEGKITTSWAEKVNPVNPQPEYPRPQMV